MVLTIEKSNLMGFLQMASVAFLLFVVEFLLTVLSIVRFQLRARVSTHFSVGQSVCSSVR